MKALKKAIKAAGSRSALAENIGVTRQAVEKWEALGIPTDRILDIENACGGAVKRHELLPAMFDGYVLATPKQKATA